MIKHLDARVVRVWEGLRPMTKKMLVGVLESRDGIPANGFAHTFEYDAHSDWELSQLLSALDADGLSKNNDRDAAELAETCEKILAEQSGSAEVFIQLASRAIKQHNYAKLDKLSDALFERYSSAEIAEIIRQAEFPQIRAIAYETLAMISVQQIVPLLDDPLYSEIAANALEQKAFEFDSEEARDVLEHLELGSDRIVDQS